MVRRKYIVTTKRQKKKWSSQMSYVMQLMELNLPINDLLNNQVYQYAIPVLSNISTANLAQNIMKVKNFKVSLTINNFKSIFVPTIPDNPKILIKNHISLCYYKQNMSPEAIQGLVPLNKSYLYTCPEYVLATKVIQYSIGNIASNAQGSINANNLSQITWNVSSRLARNLQTGDGIFLLISTFPFATNENGRYVMNGHLDGVIRYWTVSQ